MRRTAPTYWINRPSRAGHSYAWRRVLLGSRPMSLLPAQRGFTLMEVVLSIGIGLFLLMALYQSTAMHYAQTDAGMEIADRGQLIRGLEFRMRRDLESVFTGYQPPAAPNQGRGSADGSASMGSSANIASDSEIPAGGVRGFPDALSVLVWTSPADLDFSPDVSTLDGLVGPGEWRLVRYQMSDEREMDAGLLREELWFVPPAPGLEGLERVVRSDLLAPEVVGLQFRYFDGSSWIETWDSATEPPRLVEVRMELVPRPIAIPSVSPAAGDAYVVLSHRFVVALPPAPQIEAGSGASSDDGTQGASGSGSAGGGGDS